MFKKLISNVFRELSEGLAKQYTYHSITHISMVYRDATFLGNYMKLSSNELVLLQTAAALHDYGFLFHHKDHEERSCEEASKKLPQYGFSADEINQVCGMIMATKLPQSPKNIFEQIICDADLFYLGSDYYFEIASTFKSELTSLGILQSDEQWQQIQISFLEKHEYFLPFSKMYLEPTKQKNLSILKGVS